MLIEDMTEDEVIIERLNDRIKRLESDKIKLEQTIEIKDKILGNVMKAIEKQKIRSFEIYQYIEDDKYGNENSGIII